MKKYIDKVKLFLLSFHIKINERDQQGATKLIKACIDNNEKKVKNILAHPRLDINAQTERGITALIQASML